jgi:diguanylate cyclase (GGDEF)-like protein
MKQKESSIMKFDNITQASAFIRMLRKYYSLIRILDADRREIFYENKDNSISDEVNVPIECNHEAAFSIRENSGQLEIVTSISVTVDSQTYILECIHLGDKNISTTSIEHIQRLVITDSLTNLYNRRYIDEQLPIDLERTFLNSNPVSFIYADIDYFKKINDQYGHIAGDYILKEIAVVFLQHIRRRDGWVARYGGDEFLICLPELKCNTAGKIAYRLRNAVENKSININDHHLKVTCSFGVQTVYKTSGVHTVSQVVELIDKKLYQAKNKGRNKVVI